MAWGGKSATWHGRSSEDCYPAYGPSLALFSSSPTVTGRFSSLGSPEAARGRGVEGSARDAGRRRTRSVERRC